MQERGRPNNPAVVDQRASRQVLLADASCTVPTVSCPHPLVLLNHRYTRVMPPAAMSDLSLEYDQSRLGLVLGKGPGGELFIAQKPLEGTPAADAGLVQGEIVTEVAGIRWMQASVTSLDEMQDCDGLIASIAKTNAWSFRLTGRPFGRRPSLFAAAEAIAEQGYDSIAVRVSSPSMAEDEREVTLKRRGKAIGAHVERGAFETRGGMTVSTLRIRCSIHAAWPERPHNAHSTTPQSKS